MKERKDQNEKIKELTEKLQAGSMTVLRIYLNLTDTEIICKPWQNSITTALIILC